ncbi:MAG: NADH:flavin oxidoreductase [Holophagaceae bacterium]|nr:NADH:flavin oxidoreductase [Holophagaceae bacterium]
MTKISEPIQIKSLQLKNRIVMAPIVTGLAIDNRVTEACIRWYEAPVRAGVALVVLEASAVDSMGLIVPNQFGIWDDSFIAGLKQLVDSIHRNGAKVIIQLVHSGGRAWRAEGDNTLRLSPSGVCLMSGPDSKEMNEAEIQAVIDSYTASAIRAKQTGFDGIEIHAAHYYLYSQFLSPLTNRRQDKWGKDIEGRARIVVETIKAIRNVVGKDFIISCRMHAVELFDGGMSTDDSAQIVKLLETAGADIINASAIGSGSWEIVDGKQQLQTTSVPPPTGKPGIYIPYTAKLKSACNIPVIAVGRLAEPGVADVAMDSGIDLIAIARQIIADPQTPKKMLEGRYSDINPCKKCLNCFKTMRTGGIRCPVNVGWDG